MSGKCRDGVDLPDFGPCLVCGAAEWEQCRGRAYATYMKLKHADKRSLDEADYKKIATQDSRRAH
jgi:hypothetical protein